MTVAHGIEGKFQPQVMEKTEGFLIPEQIRELDKYLAAVIDEVVARAQQAIKTFSRETRQAGADALQPGIKVL